MKTNGSAARRSSRVLIGIAAAAVGLHAVAAWLARNIGLLVTQDDAYYILLARSIRAGGYQDLFSVGLPIHTLYPPGYPALLAVWGVLFGEGFDTFIVLSVLLSAAALWIMFLTLRKLVSPEFALLCVAVLAANADLVLRAGSVRSEVPFMFFLALFAWAAVGIGESRRHLTVAAIAAIAAALTRSLGAALPLALLLHLLIGRRFRALVAVGIAGLLTVGVWQSWMLISAGDASPSTNYVAAVTGGWEDPAGANLVQVVADRVVANVSVYGKVLPGQLFPAIPGTPIDNAIAFLVWALGLLAGAWLFLRRWRPAVLVLVVIAPVLAVWPFRVGRFVEPYLPIIVPCVLFGSGYLVGRLKASWRRPAMYALAGLFTLTGIVETAQAVKTRMDCGEFSLANPPSCIWDDVRSFLQAVDYVDRELPEDAVFVSAKPEPLFYYTGRQSIDYRRVRYAAESTDMSALLREQGVTHVLLGSVHFTEPERLEGRLTRICDELSVVASFPPRTLLLALRQPPDSGGRITRADESPAPADDACAALLEYRAANVGHDFHLGRRRPPHEATPSRP